MLKETHLEKKVGNLVLAMTLISTLSLYSGACNKEEEKKPSVPKKAEGSTQGELPEPVHISPSSSSGKPSIAAPETPVVVPVSNSEIPNSVINDSQAESPTPSTLNISENSVPSTTAIAAPVTTDVTVGSVSKNGAQENIKVQGRLSIKLKRTLDGGESADSEVIHAEIADRTNISEKLTNLTGNSFNIKNNPEIVFLLYECGIARRSQDLTVLILLEKNGDIYLIPFESSNTPKEYLQAVEDNLIKQISVGLELRWAVSVQNALRGVHIGLYKVAKDNLRMN